MGHRHHGSCGGRGCGGCGWGGGWGGAGLVPVPAYGGVNPQTYGMTDVMAANGMVVQTPVTAGYPSFGQAPLAAYTAPAQVLAQYTAMSAQAGFPVVPVIAPTAFKPKKIRKKKTRTVVLHSESIITGDVVYLFIPCRTAKHFDIRSLRIGRHYLISTARHGVSAELYSVPGGVAIPLPGGIFLPGQPVCLKVKNHDCKHSHWFRASLIGATL